MQNHGSKRPMTKELILRMHKGREDQINWDRVPPDVNDFPYDVQKAIVAYNKLSDNVVADIGYMGKDFGLVNTLIEVERVYDKELFLETLLRLDQFFIEKSRKDMEEARKRAKRSGKG